MEKRIKMKHIKNLSSGAQFVYGLVSEHPGQYNHSSLSLRVEEGLRCSPKKAGKVIEEAETSEIIFHQAIHGYCAGLDELHRYFPVTNED